jgi:hypothetical protein
MMRIPYFSYGYGWRRHVGKGKKYLVLAWSNSIEYSSLMRVMVRENFATRNFFFYSDFLLDIILMAFWNFHNIVLLVLLYDHCVFEIKKKLSKILLFNNKTVNFYFWAAFTTVYGCESLCMEMKSENNKMNDDDDKKKVQQNENFWQ